VDRMTTGRRHIRAGSVHVTELINKQARRTGVPAPLAAPSAGSEPDTLVDVLEPIEPDLPAESKGFQLAKLTSIGAATLVLCGSVAAATMISHQRADQQVAERPTIRITGDQALLPDRLDHTLPSSGAPAPPVPRPAERPAPAKPPAPEHNTDHAEHRAVPKTPAGTVGLAPAPAVAPVSDADLVRMFYRLLPRDPSAAFGLISPSTLKASLGEFLDSWSTVEGVDIVNIHEQADGVVAVIRMTLGDGGRILMEQLLTVADSPHRIVAAQLLSAQRN
jgi:hypothetical protein